MIAVDTSQYEKVHGKRPSGVSLWGFEISGHGVLFRGTWREARAAASGFARKIVGLRHGTVHVKP